MRLRKATLAALVLTGAAVALAIVFGGGKDAEKAQAVEVETGEPTVSIVSPRNGEVQKNHAVVVKVDLENFQLAPRNFMQEPQLGEGFIRFSLNKVPNCVDPVRLKRAIESPLGNNRLKGASMDFPGHAGPNGILAKRIDSQGTFSPATLPEIYYDRLPPGFFRLTVTLAQNNGTTMPQHAVTNFQILLGGHQTPEPCPAGYVTSAKAAEQLK